MKNLKSTTKILDTDLSVRAINVIKVNLCNGDNCNDVTIADIIDNKELIFNGTCICTERTKKEINHLILDYLIG